MNFEEILAKNFSILRILLRYLELEELVDVYLLENSSKKNRLGLKSMKLG